MQVRRAKKSDEKSIEALWDYCFEKRGEPFFDWYFNGICDIKDVLIGEESGKAACNLHCRPYKIRLRNEIFNVDYLVGLATHPAARGKGYAKEIIRSALRLACKKGQAITILMPSDASIYYPLGFGFYAFQWERSARPEDLKKISERAFKTQTIEDTKEWKTLDFIYRTYTKDFEGCTVRDEKAWKNRIEGQLQEGYIAIMYDEENPCGYIFYAIVENSIICSEIAFTNEYGRRGIYAYMASHIGQVEKCTWYEPISDTSYLYWNDGAEHKYIENRTFPFMMMRINDPVMAIDGLSCNPLLEGSLSFIVTDPFLSENNGIYHLRARNGYIHAVKEDVLYDLKLHIEEISGLKMGDQVPEPYFCIKIGDLSQLLAGTTDLKTLSEKGRIKWLTEEEQDKRSAILFCENMFPHAKTWISEWY